MTRFTSVCSLPPGTKPVNSPRRRSTEGEVTCEEPSQPRVSSKTTTSPRCTFERSASIRETAMRSSSTSVLCIDGEGIQKTWTMKARSSDEITRATTMIMRISRSHTSGLRRARASARSRSRREGECSGPSAGPAVGVMQSPCRCVNHPRIRRGPTPARGVGPFREKCQGVCLASLRRTCRNGVP